MLVRVGHMNVHDDHVWLESSCTHYRLQAVLCRTHHVNVSGGAKWARHANWRDLDIICDQSPDIGHGVLHTGCGWTGQIREESPPMNTFDSYEANGRAACGQRRNASLRKEGRGSVLRGQHAQFQGGPPAVALQVDLHPSAGPDAGYARCDAFFALGASSNRYEWPSPPCY